MATPDIGPRYVLVGDPTVAAGAGMIDLGLSRKVVQSAESRKKVPKDAFGNARPGDGVYLGAGGTVAVDVPRGVAEAIKTYLSEFASDGKFLARGAAIPHRSLAVVHPDAVASAAADAKTRWYHSVDNVSIPDLENNTQDDDAPEEFVTIEFMAGYADETQGAVAIPDTLQPFASGADADAAGLGYTLGGAYAVPGP